MYSVTRGQSLWTAISSISLIQCLPTCAITLTGKGISFISRKEVTNEMLLNNHLQDVYHLVEGRQQVWLEEGCSQVREQSYQND
jgi:hypothetical protein